MSNNVNLHDVDLQESSMLNDQPNRSSVSQMEYDMTKRPQPQPQPQPQAPGGYSATIASPPTTIHLPPPEGSPHPPIIHLNLRTLTGQMMAVELPHIVGVTTVGNLKSAVEATHGIPVSFQRLIFAGRELQDANTLVSYGIEDGYTVHLLLRQNQPTPEQQAQYAAAAAANPQAIPPGVAVAIPIHAMPMAIAPEAAERMTITYQLGRYVKMFAVIDAIFAVIWSFTFWPAAIGVFLAICGYYGAQNYQRKFVALYAIYLILSIALRIYWITSSVPLIYIFILAIGIIIEFYILHLVWKFMRVLKHLTYDERMELISMRHRGGFMG